MLTGPRKLKGSLKLSAAERMVLASIENLIKEGGSLARPQSAFIEGNTALGIAYHILTCHPNSGRMREKSNDAAEEHHARCTPARHL